MENGKMIFKNIKDVLSRDEMKKVMAGSGLTLNCSCRCENTAGQWTGTYSSYAQVGNAERAYCSPDAGICRC